MSQNGSTVEKPGIAFIYYKEEWLFLVCTLFTNIIADVAPFNFKKLIMEALQFICLDAPNISLS